MPELIAAIILFVSLAGIGVILFRKMPVLAKMPANATKVNLGHIFLSSIKKAKNLTPLKRFSTDVFLQKILSKARVLILKMENKTGSWLQHLRENSKKAKFGESDNYWQKIKDSTSQVAKKIKRKKGAPE